MNLGYLGLGVALLVAVAVDLLWTTLWVEGGAGPVTTRLMRWVWEGLRRVTDSDSRGLSLVGPFVLALTTLVWVALMWTGWTLVFASTEGTLVDALNRGAPITWVDRLYFTGYTVFTLGNGDYVPRDGVWQVATVLATGGGMLLVTLSITYVLSVLDAVSQKRAFANGVTGLGTDGETVVRAGWDGEAFDSLALPLNTFTSELNSLTANHKAYPILHYFYTPDGDRAPTLAIAVLDDALTTLRYGVPAADRPDEAVVRSARSAVGSYLDLLDSMTETPDREPPVPDLGSLRAEGVPTVPADQFEESLDRLAERRRRLLAIVEFDSRRWPAAESGGDDGNDAGDARDGGSDAAP